MKSQGSLYVFLRDKTYLKQDPLYQVSQGEKLFDHIDDALILLRKKPQLEDNRTWISEAQGQLVDALNILAESKTLETPEIIRVPIDEYEIQTELHEFSSAVAAGSTPVKREEIDASSVLSLTASFVAIISTVSTILLSWRKDIREAKAAIRRLEAESPNQILIP